MLLSRLYRLAALPLVLLPAVFVMAACAPLYAPNAVNAPLLADGGEVQGAARLGSNGMGAQVTAALTDHVGVMANASAYPFGERAPAEEPPSDFRHHRLVEGALGYFGHGLFSKERVRYAIWAGYGRGQAEVVSVIDPAVVPGPSVETERPLRALLRAGQRRGKPPAGRAPAGGERDEPAGGPGALPRISR
jgi:hypothetical protein